MLTQQLPGSWLRALLGGPKIALVQRAATTCPQMPSFWPANSSGPSRRARAPLALSALCSRPTRRPFCSQSNVLCIDTLWQICHKASFFPRSEGLSHTTEERGGNYRRKVAYRDGRDWTLLLGQKGGTSRARRAANTAAATAGVCAELWRRRHAMACRACAAAQLRVARHYIGVPSAPNARLDDPS